MGFDPVKYVPCGGCFNGFLRRDEKAVPHDDCGGTGKRVPSNYGRPVKAVSRRGKSSPWIRKSKGVIGAKKK